MSDLLKYDHPAKAWHHALPIGNGRMGSMIYGDPSNEIFALNEDSLWSGFWRDKNRVGAASFLPLIQDLDLLRNILYSGVWTRYQNQITTEQKHG